MMIEEAIFLHATNNPAIADRIGNRFKPSKLDQGTLYPAITYERVSTDPDFTHEGPSGLVMTRFQCNCFASTCDELLKMAEELEQAFAGHRGYMGGDPSGVMVFSVQQIDREDGWNDEMAVWESRVEFMFEYALS